MHTAAMPKDLMFKLRLDEQDRDRLDAVAQHLSAPAATAIRMLIKEKYDAIGGDDLEPLRELRHDHYMVLEQLRSKQPTTAEQLGLKLQATGRYPWFLRILKQLVLSEYVTRSGEGYALSPRGRAEMKTKR